MITPVLQQRQNSMYRQRGAALLVLVTLIILAASYTLLKKLNAATPAVVRAADDTRVLGEARAALIGYALSSQTRPGQLPCPDYNLDPEGNDGLSDACVENAGLVAPGRLPWQTLGLADLRDSSGERLWYAPAIEFIGATGINSETNASLLVDTNPQVVAVIIAPGGTVDGQARAGNATALDDRTRYLEGFNTSVDFDYSTLPVNPGDSFNDQLVTIRRDELIRAVERRVLREIAATVSAFPLTYAVLNSTDNCDNTSAIEQGFLPVSDPMGLCPLVAALPAWFASNNWNQVIWYASKPPCLPPGCFSVNGTPAPVDNKQILLVAGGRTIPGLSPAQSRPASVVADLLDSTLNRDGSDIFESLPLSATSNDQILVVQ